MATLTIRNLDDAVVDRLKKRAKAHHRSLEAEVRDLLEEIAEPGRHLSFRDLADLVSAMTPKNVPQTDSTDLVREDRDR